MPSIKDPNADLFALLKFVGTGTITEAFRIGNRKYQDGRIRVTRPQSSDADGVRLLELRFTSVSDEPGVSGGRVEISVVAVDPSTVKQYIPSKNINIYVTKAGIKKSGDFMHIGGHITSVPSSIKALCAEITKKLSSDKEAKSSEVTSATERRGKDWMLVMIPDAIYKGHMLKSLAELGAWPAKDFVSLLDIHFKSGRITKDELNSFRAMRPTEFRKLCMKAYRQLLKEEKAEEANSSEVTSATRKHESLLDQVRECKTSMQDAMESVTELKSYLTSSKFHDDNTVQVRDVLNRLAPIASALLSGIHTLAPALASEVIAKPTVTPRSKERGAKGAQEEYPETKTWREYMKLYASKRNEIIAEGDKQVFSLIQRFNGDILDLQCGNEVELAELQMNAHDLKMHAQSKHPEFIPLVTKIVEEYEQYRQDQE